MSARRRGASAAALHGTQKRFGGMMGERFNRDANNGYPRYIGVRAKPAQPQLRVVSSH